MIGVLGVGVLAQAGAGSFDWAIEFRPFTAFHAIVNSVCFVPMAGSLVLGVRWRDTKREMVLRRSWAIFVLVCQVGFVTYYMWPPFYVGYNLPLHVCDVAGWIAGLALLTNARWLRSILYYWGIVLSTQAFVTPIVKTGYGVPEFWAFWGLHLMIVGSALYDLIVLRYRPTWADLKSSILITGTYTGAIFVFNIIFNTNYLFIGKSRPDNPTIVDHLGPWPLRALWLSLIVIVGFTLFTAIWPGNWRRRASATVPPSSSSHTGP